MRSHEGWLESALAWENCSVTETPDFGWNDESEDFTKRSWDFERADGTPVDTLEELSAHTGRSQDALAHDVLRLPFGKAAPRKLIEEAMSRGAV